MSSFHLSPLFSKLSSKINHIYVVYMFCFIRLVMLIVNINLIVDMN